MGKIYHFLIFPIFVPKFHVVPYRISRFDVHLYTFFICFSRDSPRQETRRATPTSSSCLCIFFILRREMYVLRRKMYISRRKTCVRNLRTKFLPSAKADITVPEHKIQYGRFANLHGCIFIYVATFFHPLSFSIQFFFVLLHR